MTNLKKSKKGFTLVELIVVIAILAIIAAVAIPTTISYVGKSERTTAFNNASSIMRDIQYKITAGEIDADNFEDKVATLFKDEVVGASLDANGVLTVYTNVDGEEDEGYEMVSGKIIAKTADCGIKASSTTINVGTVPSAS